MSDKLIINAALTGMVPTRRESPHVPLTVEEIAADARRCVSAGASILHLHARTIDGAPTCCKKIYGEILARVREKCPDAVLCVSTSGRVHRSFAERSEVLDVEEPRPEMASLTLGSMNFAKAESMNAPDMIHALAGRMRERGIRPELEVFEIGMAEYAQYLVKQRILEGALYCNILLGNLGTLSATRFNLEAVVRALPEKTTWAATGIGRFQQPMTELAIAMGGHVRIGLEDNLWLDDARSTLATNVQLIDRVVDCARSHGRTPASPDETRALLGLPGLPELRL